MKIKFDNLIDVKTNKLVKVTGCGCEECVEKYERIATVAGEAGIRLRDMMSTEDHGSVDVSVDFSPH